MLIFHQGVSSTKTKKRTKSAKMCQQFNKLNNSLKKYIFPKVGSSADLKISEQNPVSVKKKSWYILNFIEALAGFQMNVKAVLKKIKFHIKPLHNVCANQVHQFAICTICIIYYTKYYTIQYRNHVFNRKKRCSIKYFRGISWDIYMSIIYQNRIYPYLRNVPAVSPCSSKQSQEQHVNFIMYVS